MSEYFAIVSFKLNH